MHVGQQTDHPGPPQRRRPTLPPPYCRSPGPLLLQIALPLPLQGASSPRSSKSVLPLAMQSPRLPWPCQVAKSSSPQQLVAPLGRESSPASQFAPSLLHAGLSQSRTCTLKAGPPLLCSLSHPFLSQFMYIRLGCSGRCEDSRSVLQWL
jgi:hypothetical protein